MLFIPLRIIHDHEMRQGISAPWVEAPDEYEEPPTIRVAGENR